MFVSAVKWNKKVQRKAYRVFNKKIKHRLQGMASSDRNFWKLVKEISGLDGDRASSTPDADDLAKHFANKMTSGKDSEDIHFTPSNSFCIPI